MGWIDDYRARLLKAHTGQDRLLTHFYGPPQVKPLASTWRHDTTQPRRRLAEAIHYGTLPRWTKEALS